MFYAETTYTRAGVTHEAVFLQWDEVDEILELDEGEEMQGTPEEDNKLVQYLADHGAPEWVDTAEGWTDEHGWGLIGPMLVTYQGRQYRLADLAYYMEDESREILHLDSLSTGMTPQAWWDEYVRRYPEDAEHAAECAGEYHP